MNHRGLSEAIDLFSDTAEPIFDALFDVDNSVIQDFPVIGMFIKALRVSNAVSDRILRAKVARFLFELQDISEEQREAFSKEVDNPRKARKISEAVIFALEQANALDKASIIGKVLKAHIKNEIEISSSKREDAFSVMMNAVGTVFLDDLTQFFQWVAKGVDAGNLNTSGLSTAGLIKTDYKSRMHVSHDVLHVPTEIGIAFAKIMLADNPVLIKNIRSFESQATWYETHNRPQDGKTIYSSNILG